MTAIDAEARACGCVTHPGLTHDEYMDMLDEAQNERLRRQAVQSAHWAAAALDRVAMAELQRLSAKIRMMEQGLIRDVSTLSAKERRAYERAREATWQRLMSATPDTARWHSNNDWDEQEER